MNPSITLVGPDCRYVETIKRWLETVHGLSKIDRTKIKLTPRRRDVDIENIDLRQYRAIEAALKDPTTQPEKLYVVYMCEDVGKSEPIILRGAGYQSEDDRLRDIPSRLAGIVISASHVDLRKSRARPI